MFTPRSFAASLRYLAPIGAEGVHIQLTSTGLQVNRAITRISCFEVCKAMCPSRGRIEHEGFRGREITIDFDGSSEAKWTSSRGGTVNLGCGGEGG